MQTTYGALVSLRVNATKDLSARISLPRLARILVQHGVSIDCPDLAAWCTRNVRKTDSSCSLRGLRNFLGY